MNQIIKCPVCPWQYFPTQCPHWQWAWRTSRGSWSQAPSTHSLVLQRYFSLHTLFVFQTNLFYRYMGRKNGQKVPVWPVWWITPGSSQSFIFWKSLLKERHISWSMSMKESNFQTKKVNSQFKSKKVRNHWQMCLSRNSPFGRFPNKAKAIKRSLDSPVCLSSLPKWSSLH